MIDQGWLGYKKLYWPSPSQMYFMTLEWFEFDNSENFKTDTSRNKSKGVVHWRWMELMNSDGVFLPRSEVMLIKLRFVFSELQQFAGLNQTGEVDADTGEAGETLRRRDLTDWASVRDTQI